MKPKLVILFAVIVLIPLGLLAWLGVRMNQDENRRAAAQLERLHAEKLDEWSNRIGESLDAFERDLLGMTEALPLSADPIREHIRKTPGIGHIIIVDSQQSIVHPPKNITQNESAFLQRIYPFIQQFPTLYPPMESLDELAEYGWNHWYYGNGAQFLFWRRLTNGLTIGIEIPRAVMLSRVINILPEDESSTRYLLRDGSGKNMYHWGTNNESRIVAARAFQEPLNMWNLEAYGSPPPTTGFASIVPTLIGIAILIVIIAYLFYRENAAEMSVAMQKVSFVNQVSHELKTPLTNIRLYAELLENRLTEAAPREKAHLKVVVSESQRLSRLINNVLTFARRDRQSLSFKPEAAVVDEVLNGIIEQFKPVFEEREIEIVFKPNAPRKVMLDSDILCQIVGNLLNNIEKYAAEGLQAEMTSEQVGHQTIIRISDQGPGIPNHAKTRIFQPFYRISNKVSDGVSGTGIGLTIARELAELHQGSLQLEPSSQGACFILTLYTPENAA